MGFSFQGSGFRIQALGFKGFWSESGFYYLEFRVKCFGFEVERSGFGVWGLGFRIQGFGLRVGKMLGSSVDCLHYSKV